MISLKKYSEEFEAIYYAAVDKRVEQGLRDEIVTSCKKYFPKDFFDDSSDELKTLILSPYKELKKAFQYLTSNKLKELKKECFNLIDEKFTISYQKFHDIYDNVTVAKKDKVQMNVLIVKENHIQTCPYCNRDYINSRAENKSGAQLDHFYDRKRYPIFALCLYNLVPVCGNCNRIKSSTNIMDHPMISPFDDSIDMSSSVMFEYNLEGINDFVPHPKGSNGLEHNISVMNIDRAYSIHDLEVRDIIKKSRIYNKSQESEIRRRLKKRGEVLSHNDFIRLVYGIDIKTNDFGSKPLSKMTYDILRDLKVEF